MYVQLGKPPVAQTSYPSWRIPDLTVNETEDVVEDIV